MCREGSGTYLDPPASPKRQGTSASPRRHRRIEANAGLCVGCARHDSPFRQAPSARTVSSAAKAARLNQLHPCNMVAPTMEVCFKSSPEQVFRTGTAAPSTTGGIAGNEEELNIQDRW